MTSIRYDKVIVFGPTGGVGGSAAVEANKRGAEVWLALRDPSKTISALSPEEESSGSFHRIKADLSDAASVERAITTSGAKAAFIYHVSSEDGMLACLRAMKEAGIEYVVFLSSFSLRKNHDDLRAIKSNDFIPFFHARVELNMQDLEIPHVAVRPAQFASNPFNLGLDMSTSPWSASVISKELLGDGIAPIDIGRVAGAVLVDRPATANPSLAFYLCGPELNTEGQKWEVIQRVTGKTIVVKEVSPKSWGEHLIAKKGLPPPIVHYLIGETMDGMKTARTEWYDEPRYSESVANIKKYSGYEPTSYESFVKGCQAQGLLPWT